MSLIYVLVTADTCGPCKNLKADPYFTRKTLHAEAIENGHKLLHISVPSFNHMDDLSTVPHGKMMIYQHHTEGSIFQHTQYKFLNRLKDCVKWFPFIVAFPEEEFFSSIRNDADLPRGFYYHSVPKSIVSTDKSHEIPLAKDLEQATDRYAHYTHFFQKTKENMHHLVSSSKQIYSDPIPAPSPELTRSKSLHSSPSEQKMKRTYSGGGPRIPAHNSVIHSKLSCNSSNKIFTGSE